MEPEKLKEIFEDKYKNRLGLSFSQWLENAPQSESQAYTKLNAIDAKLNQTYDKWFAAKGVKKEKLQNYREKLKAEYDFLEELFGLEAQDKNW